MRRKPRRPTYYTVSCLRDGTVVAAFPVRKPAPKILKRDKLRIDADNVCREYVRSGSEIGNAMYEGRIRFQDIISNMLNTRRAIREIVLPRLGDMETNLAALQSQLQRIEHAIVALKSDAASKPNGPAPEG